MALAIGLGSSACSKTEESATGPATTGQVGTTAAGAGSPGTTAAKSGTTMAPATKTPTISAASELRTTLTQLLNAHTILAANATGAALGGRSEEFEAAAAQLDANTKAITDAIVGIYGPDAELFGDGWKAHIGFFVDYTQAAAKGDAAGKEKAAKDLDGYAGDLAAFLGNANPNLPKDAVAELVRGHIKTLLAVIDAQAAKDYSKHYRSYAEAMNHMHEIGDPLAGAIAKQFPEKFPIS
ncbi:MAG: hypothetical protein N2037_09635 [Acidimicrobiales bacterium]|nr:hypothetical protein [Acidimicrobiales bacterium]